MNADRRSRSNPIAGLSEPGGGFISLPVDRLRPNDWNPNEMAAEEFAEYVAEVRHLGRVPKPVVVCPDDDGWTIVDGEHAWEAAREVGLAEVLCEVVDIDPFEAMRQTYKRNQHGTRNPVALGFMFESMMQARGLSQRSLAKEIGVSEGTIRNALLYAEAARLRNGYAWKTAGVRVVRAYLSIPESDRDFWLDEGADLDYGLQLAQQGALGTLRQLAAERTQIEDEYIRKLGAHFATIEECLWKFGDLIVKATQFKIVSEDEATNALWAAATEGERASRFVEETGGQWDDYESEDEDLEMVIPSGRVQWETAKAWPPELRRPGVSFKDHARLRDRPDRFERIRRVTVTRSTP